MASELKIYRNKLALLVLSFMIALVAYVSVVLAGTNSWACNNISVCQSQVVSTDYVFIHIMPDSCPFPEKGTLSLNSANGTLLQTVEYDKHRHGFSLQRKLFAGSFPMVIDISCKGYAHVQFGIYEELPDTLTVILRKRKNEEQEIAPVRDSIAVRFRDDASLEAINKLLDSLGLGTAPVERNIYSDGIVGLLWTICGKKDGNVFSAFNEPVLAALRKSNLVQSAMCYGIRSEVMINSKGKERRTREFQIISNCMWWNPPRLNDQREKSMKMLKVFGIKAVVPMADDISAMQFVYFDERIGYGIVMQQELLMNMKCAHNFICVFHFMCIDTPESTH